MNIVMIPRKLASRDDLVVIPREEYEALLARPDVREFAPTKVQLKALRAAEKRFSKGQFYSLSDVKRDLASRRRR